MDSTEFQSKFPQEQWFKVVAYDPVKQQFFRRNLFFTIDSVTTDPVPFNPDGECQAGGIYFALLKDIHRYCDVKNYGDWVAPVSFVPKSNGIPTTFYLEQHKAKANQIVLGQPISLKQFCFKYIHRNQELFSVAARYGYENVIQLGLELLIYNYAIYWASQNGHAEVVRLLLTDPRVDPSVRGNEEICHDALAKASQNGHVEVVRLLLTDPRVDPSALNNYAIRFASQNGHVEVVQLLLSDHRVDPSAHDNYAIRWTCYNGHAEVVRLLLSDPRVDPSAQDNYAVSLASRNGHAEVVRLLLTDPRVSLPNMTPKHSLQK
jgi:hypothetical protein